MSSAAPGSLAVLPATMPEGTHLAVFAAGCFWGTESTFAALPGVTGTRVRGARSWNDITLSSADHQPCPACQPEPYLRR